MKLRNDPLPQTYRSRANLRIRDIEEIKTFPIAPPLIHLPNALLETLAVNTRTKPCSGIIPT